MIRQLLTRRPHHVPYSALPIKVCYSQTPTPDAKFVSRQSKLVSRFAPMELTYTYEG